MLKLVLRGHPIEALPENHPDAATFGHGQFMAPVGFQNTGVKQSPRGDLHIFGLESPNGLQVEHRVVMIMVGGSIDLPIGVKLGEHLGDCMVPVQGGAAPAQVFRYGEWPTTALAGLSPAGAA